MLARHESFRRYLAARQISVLMATITVPSSRRLRMIPSACGLSEQLRSKLPQRPGRARGLAGTDGARDAVHFGRPVADQYWPDVAVVQDGAATAARAGKPLCAAVVSVSAVRTDRGWVNCAVAQGVGESPVGSARRSPTVEHHPVGDSVTAVARVVVRAVEATPDFCGELSLLIGITGRKVSPGWRGDETGEADGFGIDRREQPGCAERGRLAARRDENLGAAGPFAVNTDAVFPPIRPEVAGEQEPGQHRVVGGSRTVAAQQPQVLSLRTDDVVEAGETWQRLATSN
ncbi:MAG: hypothetical protein QOI29_3600 [Mycobacterium sp.]|nr:hypothetical protein [Mycobacterium sp.]